MSSGSYTYHYLFLGVFLVIACIFPFIPIVLTRLLAPKKPGKEKQSLYECGLESSGDSWVQFKVQYYLYALLFIVFDVEVVFIYPWAVAYKQMGIFAFVEMLIFLAILSIGLIYAWKKKILEWK